jgi:hypothetical protein
VTVTVVAGSTLTVAVVVTVVLEPEPKTIGGRVSGWFPSLESPHAAAPRPHAKKSTPSTSKETTNLAGFLRTLKTGFDPNGGGGDGPAFVKRF